MCVITFKCNYFMYLISNNCKYVINYEVLIFLSMHFIKSYQFWLIFKLFEKKNYINLSFIWGKNYVKVACRHFIINFLNIINFNKIKFHHKDVKSYWLFFIFFFLSFFLFKKTCFDIKTKSLHKHFFGSIYKWKLSVGSTKE